MWWARAASVNDGSEEFSEEMSDALSEGAELNGVDSEESEELPDDLSEEAQLNAMDQDLPEMKDLAGAWVLDGRHTCARLPCSFCCASASQLSPHAGLPDASGRQCDQDTLCKDICSS